MSVGMAVVFIALMSSVFATEGLSTWSSDMGDRSVMNKYGGLPGRNGKYLVSALPLKELYTNQAADACESSRAVCLNCTLCDCKLVREVSLDELRQECPPMLQGLRSDSGHVIIQMGHGHTGSTFQYRMITTFLRYLDIKHDEKLVPKSTLFSDIMPRLKNSTKPCVIKTHHHIDPDGLVDRELADIVFNSVNPSVPHKSYTEMCPQSWWNTYKTKTCKCCITVWQTRNNYAARLAEFMMLASSLGVPNLDQIDFDVLMGSMTTWYTRKYGKVPGWDFTVRM